MRLIKNPLLIISYLGRLGLLNWIPDKTYLRIVSITKFGKNINFNSPKTFNEKLQWLKIYDRKQFYTSLVDKKEVKNIINDLLGEEFLIKTIQTYNSPKDINLENLPKSFVLKCTHDSGGVVVCKDKNKLDLNSVKKKLNKHLKQNYYWGKREWPYKNIEPKIICEEYIVDNKNDSLVDYKFYCFNGVPKFCQVIKGRNTNETIDFFDMDWEHMPFTGMRILPNSNIKISKPKYLKKMIYAAKVLSEDMPFVRVDFYHTENQVYFGEMTFYPQSGFGEIKPNDWNIKLGGLIKLPLKNKNKEGIS